MAATMEKPVDLASAMLTFLLQKHPYPRTEELCRIFIGLAIIHRLINRLAVLCGRLLGHHRTTSAKSYFVPHSYVSLYNLAQQSLACSQPCDVCSESIRNI